MSFRLRQGLNALVTLGVVVACNTYTPELLTPEDPETTSGGSDMDSTLTTGSGGSKSNVTTTINTTTSTSSGPNGGDGGSGGGTTSSAEETTTGGGGSGGDTNMASTTTEPETTNTNTTGGGNGGSDSTAGTGGNGGSSGNGGSGGSTTTGTPLNVLIIDDLEDRNNQLETPTYTGYWFTTANEDGDGTLTPLPDDDCDPVELETPRGTSEWAMHISGNWSGTDLEWIAAAGFPLRHDETAVDASGYTGVKFYARTDSDETAVHLQVMLKDVKDEGHFSIEIPLTESWQEYTVLWSDPLLMQPTWAAEVDFDAATLFKFQFQFDSEVFDLWVDDIEFLEP